MTPNPHPSGDLPADTSQVTPLANYAPAMVPPDPGTDPVLTQFILAVQGIYDGIAANSADRPAYWGENVATGTGIFCPPVRCNTLPGGTWRTISIGYGTTSRMKNSN